MVKSVVLSLAYGTVFAYISMMKLLIVDDSALIRRAIDKFLGKGDIDIVGQAGDGVKALELFKEHGPDVVTLDITMPEMDGLTCLEEMMKVKANAKVLVISALTKPGIAIDALDKGAKHFLKKPFTESELLEAFEKVVNA